MQNIGALIEDHKHLFHETEVLKQLVHRADFEAAEALAALRALADGMGLHMAAESTVDLPDRMQQYLACPEREVRAFEAALDRLMHLWDRYMQHWTPAEVDADRWGFRTDTLWMMDCMQDRIREENNVLFPLALLEAEQRAAG